MLRKSVLLVVVACLLFTGRAEAPVVEQVASAQPVRAEPVRQFASAGLVAA